MESRDRANQTLATLQQMTRQHNATADSLRKRLVTTRERLLPLRNRLRREIRQKRDDKKQAAYQRVCAHIAHLDNTIGMCDEVKLDEPEAQS